MAFSGRSDIKVDPIDHELVSMNLFNGKPTLYLGGYDDKIFRVVGTVEVVKVTDLINFIKEK